jgi:hypothetical protein
MPVELSRVRMRQEARNKNCKQKAYHGERSGIGGQFPKQMRKIAYRRKNLNG